MHDPLQICRARSDLTNYENLQLGAQPDTVKLASRCRGERTMNLRVLAYPIIMGGVIYCWATDRSAAQSNAAPIKSTQSSGVTVSISKVSVAVKKITLQFIISNQTKARVYLRDALAEASQKAFLGSGERLSGPQIVGLEWCNSSVSGCITNQGEMNDLSKFSYIEPSEFTAGEFEYYADSPVNENDTVSFSVALIARFATPSGDPLQVGLPTPIRFNFPYVPLSHH